MGGTSQNNQVSPHSAFLLFTLRYRSGTDDLHCLACTVLTLLHAYLCQAFTDTYRFSIYLSHMQHRRDTELEETERFLLLKLGVECGCSPCAGSVWPLQRHAC